MHILLVIKHGNHKSSIHGVWMILMGKASNYIHGRFSSKPRGKLPDDATRQLTCKAYVTNARIQNLYLIGVWHVSFCGTWDGSKRYISRLFQNSHVDEIILNAKTWSRGKVWNPISIHCYLWVCLKKVIPHLCNFDRENDKEPVDGMGYIFYFQTNPYGFHENQTIGYCTA